MREIDIEVLAKSLAEQGVKLFNLRMLTGGANHIVFEGKDESKKSWIIKFPTVRETEKQFGTAHLDTMFGGELSLARESYLFDLVRESGIPAPIVMGTYDTPYGNCIVVECTSGCNMPDYMEANGHSFEQFLSIMTSLGNHFRILHKTRFPSFGNIMKDRVIEPSGITNFCDRYRSINDGLMEKCRAKGGLSESEFKAVTKFFDEKFKKYEPVFDINVTPATLVITDMHGGNFFVDNGEVSGYFDLESSQAAPWQFELYGMRFFVFNFYGKEEYELAEKAFWSAYFEGKQDFPNKEDDEITDFFGACRLMEIFQSYWGHIDGLRDTWGERIKKLLLDYMETGFIDYCSLGEIWRERDGQPAVAKRN